MQRITTLFGGNNGDEEEDFLHEFDGSGSLSPLQRIYGFAACLVGGLACVFLSMIVFAEPIKFALLFTVGNLLAVGNAAFLIGPTHQLQMMLDSVRVYATVIYIGNVIVALFCALLVHSKLLTILAMIVEICALVWYGLSYIPFARNMVELAVSELLGNGAGIVAAASTVVSTFLLVFVAEWGDKSFFSTIALAAASSPLGVIGGALAGHAVATMIAVLGGSLLGTFFSERVIGYIGGSLFLVFAALTLIDIIY